jgi:hypothetical protein
MTGVYDSADAWDSKWLCPPPSGKGTDCDAVAKIAMHGCEHLIIIRPAEEGLVLHRIYFANERPKANRVGGADGKFTAREIEFAKRLIDTPLPRLGLSRTSTRIVLQRPGNH